MSTAPIQTNQLLFIADLFKKMFDGMKEGATVTRYVIEAQGGGDQVEFEVRVTRIGKKRLPRVVKS